MGKMDPAQEGSERARKVWYPNRDHGLWPVPDEKPVPLPNWSLRTKVLVLVVQLLMIGGIVVALWYGFSR